MVCKITLDESSSEIERSLSKDLLDPRGFHLQDREVKKLTFRFAGWTAPEGGARFTGASLGGTRHRILQDNFRVKSVHSRE